MKEHLKEHLKDPEFKRLYDYYGKQLEISYQLLQLRKKQKIASAFGKELKISIG